MKAENVNVKIKELNTMKLTKTTLVIILSLLIFLPDLADAQIFVPLSAPGEQGALVLNNIKGSINVTGYDGDIVIIDASSSGEGKISSESLQINTQEENNEVTIFYNSPGTTIDFNIKVPYNFSLKLSVYHIGKITVRNVSGEFEINNINGDIELSDVSGSAVLSTVDGDINVTFRDVTPDVPMAFTSVEGKIDITFPSDVTAQLKMKSDNGEIFADFDMKLEKRQSQVEKSVTTGVYKVDFDEWTYGYINGGGQEILLKSVYGNIYIRQRK